MEEKKFRVESDLLGELQVPEEAYYGVQTQRAINNYHISRKRMCDYPDYVVAIAYVKLAAVETNRQLGEISDEVADAMAQACRELIDGKMHENFVTDMVQGGAGTSEINMGGTAIGTGLNAAPGFPKICAEKLSELTGMEFIAGADLVEATPDTGAYVSYSSALKRLAVKLSKICNDLRLLASGPRCGLNEINLPPMAPGSSIMPGKVNPVIPEVTNQTCFKVIGNDTTVMIAAEAGQLQLNVMEPIITECLIEDLTWLPNAMDTLREKCIDGITVNKERCLDMVKHSIGIVTALNPYIGYKNSTKIAKEALATGGSVYDLVLEHKILSKEKLDAILSPEHMLKQEERIK